MINSLFMPFLGDLGGKVHNSSIATKKARGRLSICN